MKRRDFQRAWEEAQLDIALLEAEVDAKLHRIRRIHADLYEGVLGEPAPIHEPARRRVAS
jgi:hypothetical protein